MRTMLELICSEFERWGYSLKMEFDGNILFASNVGFDYWIVCSNIDVIPIQKLLYDKLEEFKCEFEYIEKNITLLLLIDNEGDLKSIDTIKVENNKSYFKKFVLQYTEKSVSELNNILTEKKVDSIADLLLSEQYFTHLKYDSQTLNGVTLLYSIAHKLPFIPIKSVTKEKSKINLNFSSLELDDLFKWVNQAPSEERDLYVYLEKFAGTYEG